MYTLEVFYEKNTIILFIINLMVFVGTIFSKNLYTNKGYFTHLINITLIINLVILTVGIIYNIIFVKNPDKYDNQKYTILIISVFLFFLLINSVFIIFSNRYLNKKYTNVNSILSSYCNEFICDKYETVTSGSEEKFIIQNTYFDYENVQNNLKITTTYNTHEILFIKAEVYSRNESFSETLIKDNLKDFFSKFHYEINENKIKEAFDKRFDSPVRDKNATYKVTEIYKNKELVNLKTIITLDLKQEQ